MNWSDVLDLANTNPAPPRRVETTDEEWEKILTPEQYRVTRRHGTEMPFSGEYCESYSPGIYRCVCCGTELFDSTGKFASGTGWPSFSRPVRDNVIKYKAEHGHGVQAMEILCNVCDAHLGHVFPDGPVPTGLRFCVNSISLKKEKTSETDHTRFETATFGGGCFWCTEAVFDELAGVLEVIPGYAGGEVKNPTYRQISGGNTGHAEVVQVRYDPRKTTYDKLLQVFFATHDPTTRNRQGEDTGTQYRSIIFYHKKAQRLKANKVIQELQSSFDKPIVTELVPFSNFYKAEQEHIDNYRNSPDKANCRVAISAKLQKLRAQFADGLK